MSTRASDVIMNRFGLTADGERKTLEEIGKKYNITRERVRQVENAAIKLIKKSEAYKNEQAIFDELKQLIHKLGSIVAEDELLSYISKDKATQNHIHFFLVLSDAFKKYREDEHFHTRCGIDDVMTDKVHEALRKLYMLLKDEDLIPETEMIKKFFDQMKDVAEEYKNEEIAKRWLSISKNLAKNPLGDWGKASSPNIRTRGVKDYAFLVMRRHGSPMHFKEVADSISKTFGKKIHYATCHNELIKDPRFILVGRGMYALAEWGYKAGIAREVIEDILKKRRTLIQRRSCGKSDERKIFQKKHHLGKSSESKIFQKK